MTEKNEALTTAADAAAFIERKAEEYARDFGYSDMGSLSFGSGDHAQVKMDHYTSLTELAEEIRALAAPSASAQQAERECNYPNCGCDSRAMCKGLFDLPMPPVSIASIETLARELGFDTAEEAVREAAFRRTHQGASPAALTDEPTHDQLRAIARDARNTVGPSDDPGSVAYVLAGWKAARALLAASPADQGEDARDE